MIIDQIIGLRGDVAIKAPVRAATTANITLSGLQTIDGVPLINNDYVLVKDQANKKENGIYVVVDSGAWVRRADFNTKEDVVKGTMVYVQEGAINRAKNFVLLNDYPTNFDADDINFSVYNPDLSIFPSLTISDKYKILEVDSAGSKYVLRDIMPVTTLSSSTTIDDTYRNKLVLCNTTLTVTLPPLANSRGYVVYIQNISSTGTVTVAANGTEKINSLSNSITLKPNETALLVYNIVDWRLVFVDRITFDSIYTKRIEQRDAVSMYNDAYLDANTGNIRYDRNIADNAAGTDTVYSTRFTNIIDNTVGSEDAQIVDQVVVNGTLTDALYLGNGLQVGAPVGAFKGTGSINAKEYYRDGYRLNAPAFNAWLGIDTSITAGVWTKITCDVEEFDSDGMYSAGRFTPLKAGRYDLTLSLQASSTANYAHQVALYFNGAFYRMAVQDYVTYNTDNHLTLRVQKSFNGTTDYAEMFAMITTGTPTIRGVHTMFSAHLIQAE